MLRSERASESVKFVGFSKIISGIMGVQITLHGSNFSIRLSMKLPKGAGERDGGICQASKTYWERADYTHSGKWPIYNYSPEF